MFLGLNNIYKTKTSLTAQNTRLEQKQRSGGEVF